MATENQEAVVSINGTRYNLSELSENARIQLNNLRIAEQEIARLRQQAAMIETARDTYARALSKALPEKG